MGKKKKREKREKGESMVKIRVTLLFLVVIATVSTAAKIKLRSEQSESDSFLELSHHLSEVARLQRNIDEADVNHLRGQLDETTKTLNKAVSTLKAHLSMVNAE